MIVLLTLMYLLLMIIKQPDIINLHYYDVISVYEINLMVCILLQLANM